MANGDFTSAVQIALRRPRPLEEGFRQGEILGSPVGEIARITEQRGLRKEQRGAARQKAMLDQAKLRLDFNKQFQKAARDDVKSLTDAAKIKNPSIRKITLKRILSQFRAVGAPVDIDVEKALADITPEEADQLLAGDPVDVIKNLSTLEKFIGPGGIQLTRRGVQEIAEPLGVSPEAVRLQPPRPPALPAGERPVTRAQLAGFRATAERIVLQEAEIRQKFPTDADRKRLIREKLTEIAAAAGVTLSPEQLDKVAPLADPFKAAIKALQGRVTIAGLRGELLKDGFEPEDADQIQDIVIREPDKAAAIKQLKATTPITRTRQSVERGVAAAPGGASEELATALNLLESTQQSPEEIAQDLTDPNERAQFEAEVERRRQAGQL